MSKDTSTQGPKQQATSEPKHNLVQQLKGIAAESKDMNALTDNIERAFLKTGFEQLRANKQTFVEKTAPKPPSGPQR